MAIMIIILKILGLVTFFGHIFYFTRQKTISVRQEIIVTNKEIITKSSSIADECRNLFLIILGMFALMALFELALGGGLWSVAFYLIFGLPGSLLICSYLMGKPVLFDKKSSEDLTIKTDHHTYFIEFEYQGQKFREPINKDTYDKYEVDSLIEQVDFSKNNGFKHLSFSNLF